MVCIAWLIIHFWVWRKKIFLGLLFGFILFFLFIFFWWPWKTHLQAFRYIWKFYFFSRKQWLFDCFFKILLILKPTQGHVKNYCQSDDKLVSENVWNCVIGILTIFGAFKLIVWAVCGIHHIGLQSLCYFLLDFLNDKANFLIRRPYFEFWILHKFIHFFKEVFLVKTFDPSKLVLQFFLRKNQVVQNRWNRYINFIIFGIHPTIMIVSPGFLGFSFCIICYFFWNWCGQIVIIFVLTLFFVFCQKNAVPKFYNRILCFNFLLLGPNRVFRILDSLIWLIRFVFIQEIIWLGKRQLSVLFGRWKINEDLILTLRFSVSQSLIKIEVWYKQFVGFFFN